MSCSHESHPTTLCILERASTIQLLQIDMNNAIVSLFRVKLHHLQINFIPRTSTFCENCHNAYLRLSKSFNSEVKSSLSHISNMCIKYTILYHAYGHSGTPEFFPCLILEWGGSCDQVLNRTQDEFIDKSQLGITNPRKSHASLMNSEFYHFCPDCFMLPNPLTADRRNASVTRKEIELAREMEIRCEGFIAETRDIWHRIKDLKTDGPLALLELVGSEFQMLTVIGEYLVRRYYGLLIVDFWWRIMLPVVLQPTKKQRMILLQLRTFMEHTLMHELKKLYLEEQQGGPLKIRDITTRVNISTLKDEEMKCTICHQLFGENVDGVIEHPVKTILCNHIFGHNCLEIWLKGSETCPLDRRVIKTAIIHQGSEAQSRGTPPWLSTLNGNHPNHRQSVWRITSTCRGLPIRIRGYPEHQDGPVAIYEPRESHALVWIHYLMTDHARSRSREEYFEEYVREMQNRASEFVSLERVTTPENVAVVGSWRRATRGGVGPWG